MNEAQLQRELKKKDRAMILMGVMVGIGPFVGMWVTQCSDRALENAIFDVGRLRAEFESGAVARDGLYAFAMDARTPGRRDRVFVTDDEGTVWQTVLFWDDDEILQFWFAGERAIAAASYTHAFADPPHPQSVDPNPWYFYNAEEMNRFHELTAARSPMSDPRSPIPSLTPSPGP